MKYLVNRTSDFWGENPPVEGAKKVSVHTFYDLSIFTDERNKEHQRKLCSNVYRYGETLRGVYKEPEERWVCEITDLHKFVEENGRIILSLPDCEEGYWNIEIYDDYRE